MSVPGSYFKLTKAYKWYYRKDDGSLHEPKRQRTAGALVECVNPPNGFSNESEAFATMERFITDFRWNRYEEVFLLPVYGGYN